MAEGKGKVERGCDPASASNCNEVVTEHLHIQLAADFEKKTLAGHVLFIFRSLIDDLSTILLDCGNLNISRVIDNALKTDLGFEVQKDGHLLGDVLKISLEKPITSGERLYVQVEYETSPSATGLQWLPPQQTDGGEHPFMFSQFQAIHARSTIPCQDSPSVKAPYTASITVPEPLVALMSAISKGNSAAAPSSSSSSSSSSTYAFEQTIPVPSYLIAFAIGKLESREISDRCRVWCESKRIEECAFEFNNTEEYLKAAEECVFPYEWGRYDLLVLPSSFPYGGMENACLTFVTPTLLAGDRSLTCVVAHEIAHSWMGNLVTNRSWNDFWLNEGFTVFLERKIIGRVKGEEHRQLAHIMGNNTLIETINNMKKAGTEDKYSTLVVSVKGDPDDAFSSVPYEKGSQLLFFLEHIFDATVQTEFKDQFDTLRFENCVRQWVTNNSGGTVTTEMFQEHIKTFYKDEKFAATHEKIDYNSWFHVPGMPAFDILSIADDVLATEAKTEADLWLQGKQEKSTEKLDSFSPNQFILFFDTVILGMEGLKEEEKKALVESLTEGLKLDKKKNCEVLFRWSMMVLMARCEKWYQNVVSFLEMQGRMKYLRPLYRAMKEVDIELARKTFAANSFRYHNIASKMVASDLGV